MSTRIAQELIMTPPRDWDELARMWSENFGILKNANVVNQILVAGHVVAATTVITTLSQHTMQANKLVHGLCITILVSGIYSNASAAEDFTIDFCIDDTIIHAIDRVAGNVTDQYWNATFSLTFLTEGTSGTFISSAIFLDGTEMYTVGKVTPDSIDTTVAHRLNVSMQWDSDTSGNIFRSNQGMFAFMKGTEED